MTISVSGILSPEQLEAINTLREGLQFHDHFGPASDDKHIYVIKGESLYEFASLSSDRVLCLGTLRDLLSIFVRIEL
jgi:hypothetical protein